MFVQHRYESMTTFLQDCQQKNPLLDLTQLINLVTGHIISHRMNWGLYIKKTLELHPICRNGVEGANKAKELAVHVSLQASNIIEQARRSYAELKATSHTANQPFSIRSVPTSSVPGLVPVDHAGKVDLPPLEQRFEKA